MSEPVATFVIPASTKPGKGGNKGDDKLDRWVKPSVYFICFVMIRIQPRTIQSVC
jgi:hypothetical protein